MASGGNNVRVVCRFRPQNQKEIDAGGLPILSVDDTRTSVHIKGAESNHTFAFDRVFYGASQEEVYNDAARPIVEDLMRGYNGTIFVYGQTSSGKTHTMQGPDIDDPQMRGIIPRMNSTIFEHIMKAESNLEFTVKAAYIEIYMEKIRDLLDSSKGNLKVREEKSKGIWVEGATEVYVGSEKEVLDIIRAGTANRAIAETKMNFESSRSHSIFILTVFQRNLSDGSNKTGKLYLVDLAGSEKVEKTGATGIVLDEAKMINKSLSTLGNVINALTDGKSQHIPYRDSKLTRVLQESIGGNSRTTLIINCSPSSYNEAETLSTLRFGSRAKNIKNKAKINQERSVAELKASLGKAEAQIESLKNAIAGLTEELEVLKGNGPRTSTDKPLSLPHVAALQDRVTELEAKVRTMEEEKQKLEERNDELKEKIEQAGAEQMENLNEELNNAKNNEQTLATENELLIVKLADITIANEKLQFENSECKVAIDRLSAENNNLRDEISGFNAKIEVLTEERNKASKMNTILSFQKEQHEWAEKEIDPNLENANLHVKPERDPHLVDTLKAEVDNQARELEQLRMEKQLLQAQLQTIQTTQAAERAIANSMQDGQRDASQLEKELNSLRDQTNQKMAEFDALKAALFKDLENRCQKVIELEMLLDEAREQYQTLLLQVKTSNSKALQQKCIFLQRNLEQLTTVQQQLVNENNKLKLDNQVYMKQLLIRNERIHGLELLLQDAQEKLQKYAQLDARNSKAGAAKKPQQPGSGILTGGRIAKPIRGGGGTTTTGGNSPPSAPALSINSPGNSSTTWSTSAGTKVLLNSTGGSVKESPNNLKGRSTSIWDLFSKKPADENGVTSPTKPENKP